MEEVANGADESELSQILRGLANATRVALETVRSTSETVRESVQVERRTQLSKLVRTPEVFKYDSHLEETKHFGDWQWCLRRWLESTDAEFAAELEYIEKHPHAFADNVSMTPETRDRSLALYSALSTLVQGKAQRLVRSVRAGFGYEAFRVLLNTFCPSNRQRAVALLQSICTYTPFSEKVPLEESVLAFEELTREYERAAGSPCPSEITTATLMRCSPPMVRQYLYMRLQHDSKDMTYAETRDLILNYDKASVIWQGSTTQDGLTVVLDSRNDDPMGINRLWSESQKGKGKGQKGKDQKGKGKSKGKGKDKGKGQQNQQYNHGKGSSQQHNNTKGKGRGDGNKSQHGSNRNWDNSGKQPETRACFHCGKPGHLAANCWSKSKGKPAVRQVEETNQQNQQNSSSPSTTSQSMASSSLSGSIRQVEMYDMSTPRTSAGIQRFRIDSWDDEDWQVRVVHVDVLDHFNVDGVTVHGPCIHDMTASDHNGDWTFPAEEHHGYPRCGTEDGLERWYSTSFEESLQPTCSDLQQMFTARVCAVTDNAEQRERVVIDTGADVSVAPLWLERRGEHQQDWCGAQIRNANGGEMITRGIRRMSLSMYDVQGDVVSFKEDFVVCNVNQPILAVGKLLRAGWRLGQEPGHGMCLVCPAGTTKVPIAFSKNSLEAQAFVRVVGERSSSSRRLPGIPEEQCEAQAEASPALQVEKFMQLGQGYDMHLIPGWSVTELGHPVHFAEKTDKLVDGSAAWNPGHFPFRTALASMDLKSWKIVRANEKWAEQDDREQQYTGVPRKLVTILSWEPLTEAELGMSEDEMQEYLVRLGEEVQFAAYEEDPEKGIEAGAQAEEPEQAEDVAVQADAVVPAEQVVHAPHGVEPAEIVINGQRVTRDSTLRELRAAAKFRNISGSGSKQKVWLKLVADELAIQATAASRAAVERQQEMVIDGRVPRRPREPTARQKEVHEATHQPFAPWCQACVMSRSREDSHSPSAHGEEQDGAEAGSVVQMDFMFPKADHEVPREQEKEMEKCVVLVAADKWSHAVMASVAEQKGGASSVKLTKDLFDFCLRVSMQEVTIQCDNEPGIMAIAKNVEKMRLQNGLKTHIRRPQVGQPQSNGRAERAVRTLKENAKTFRQAILLACGYSRPCSFQLEFCACSMDIQQVCSASAAKDHTLQVAWRRSTSRTRCQIW